MTSSLPSRTFNLSPFRKSVDFSVTSAEANNYGNISPSTISNNKKSKRRSLKIITRSVENSQTNNKINSPSKIRSRLSSLLKVISPASAATSNPTSAVNEIQDRSRYKQQRLSQVLLPSQSKISFLSTESRQSLSKQQQYHRHNDEYMLCNTTSASLVSTPDLTNKSKLPTAGYSSSYDDSSLSSSDHFSISQDDDFMCTTIDPSVLHSDSKRQERTHITFADKDAIMMNNLLSENATKPPPPPLPPHRHTLSFHVNQVLGSALKEVDEEIEKDWELSRKLLRQSLTLPLSYNERLRFYK